jgi:hypothetical protein
VSTPCAKAKVPANVSAANETHATNFFMRNSSNRIFG